MGVAAKIAPSMLSSDFANLASEAHRMLKDGADWLHMDIMVCALLFNREVSFFLMNFNLLLLFNQSINHQVLFFFRFGGI